MPKLQSHMPETAPRTPLPKLQLAILLYLQLAEPITSTVIYPFINQAVRGTGITGGDERKTGYYAGLIESAFYATEALCVLQWGRASDRLSRRPVLIGGLLGLTISMLGFGLSTSFWAMLLARCAAGVLNGNIGVTKSAMAELTDASNRAQGFAFMPIVWCVGSTFGPLIGGLLANPAERWPIIFNSQFWKAHPYFLPCLVAGCYSISAVILTAVGLKETLPAALERNSRQPHKNEYQVLAQEDVATEKDSPQTPSSPIPLPALRSLLTRRIITPIANYAFLALIDQAFEALQPLMYSTTPLSGGLGLSARTIGAVLGGWGALNVAVQVCAFARLHDCLGARTLYICAIGSYVLCFASFPVMNALAKEEKSIGVWALLVAQLAVYYVCTMGYGCIFIFITDSAPTRTALGATNGLAQTTASTMRAIGPSAASSLFALSQEKNLLQGTLVYWVWCAVVLGGVSAATRLPKRASTH